jgi:glycosyltransferase involved in cell wall biosynthesis
MRILFTAPGYKPAWRYGGPIIALASLAERLVQRGHEVIVFTTNANLDQMLDVAPNRPHDVDGVQVWYFERHEPLQKWFPNVPYLARSMGTLYSPLMARQLAQRAPEVDIVHAHLPFIYPTFAAGRAAARAGKPLFYSQHGVFDPERLRFRGLKKRVYLSLVEGPIVRRATTLVALTEAEVESYRLIGARGPVRVIPNGVDLPALTAPRIEDAPLGIRPDHKVVLFMGRLHPIKGADKLLEAFLRIVQRHGDAHLVLAGPDEFGIEQQFRDRVRAAGLEHRVAFPGMVQGEDKRRLLLRADLFVLPSAAEGFSMAVLEAMAAQTAVLLSPGCHFDEVEAVGAGRVTTTSVDCLSAALDDMLSDVAALRAMGARGRELAAAKYSWSDIAQQYEEMYMEGIARHGADRPLRAPGSGS